MAHVIGVDLGGTLTRVLVADGDGRGAGFGTAGGGNPVSRGLDATAASLREAVGAALSGIAPESIGYAVLGLAGVSTFGTAIDVVLDEVWAATGLTCPRAVRADPEIAFAAGTAEPDGFVLIGGTGAVAGYVRANVMTGSVDGHGWLLGDRGSGYWIGREAALAALADGEGYGPPTALRVAVTRALGLQPDSSSQQIAHAVYARPPIALSELAPCVTATADAGDEVAVGIIDRAGAHLLTTLRAAVTAAGSPRDLPVVLTGGALTGYPPLHGAVRAGIEALGLRPCVAASSVVGAAVLAVRATTGGAVPPGVRQHLLESVTPRIPRQPGPDGMPQTTHSTAPTRTS